MQPGATLRWPAEWEPHEATWLAWPTRESTWPGIFDRIPTAFIRLVETVARYEPVWLLIPGGPAGDLPRRRWGDADRIRLLTIDTDDAWVRDYGPIAVLDGGARRLIDFRFNAWGGKYPPWGRDDRAEQQMAATVGLPATRLPWVVEGGALETDGQGTIVATTPCLLDRRRNANMTRERMEAILHTWLGARHIVWLDVMQGLVGDDTDGHIDQLVRFVDPQTLVVAHSPDPLDPNHERLAALRRELERRVARLDRSWEVVPLPIARHVRYGAERLPASYCNFAFVNGAVVVPVFDDPMDDPALRVLERLVAGRAIEPVPCRDLVWGLGAVHCLTQQLPAPTGQNSITMPS